VLFIEVALQVDVVQTNVTNDLCIYNITCKEIHFTCLNSGIGQCVHES